MELVGDAVARRAVSERRHIVIELTGMDYEPTQALLEAMRAIGYAISVQAVTCDIEEAWRRNTTQATTTSVLLRRALSPSLAARRRSGRAHGQERERLTTRVPLLTEVGRGWPQMRYAARRCAPRGTPSLSGTSRQCSANRTPGRGHSSWLGQAERHWRLPPRAP